MTGSASPPPVAPDDGSPDTARWYALKGAREGPALLAELHETERVRTSCAFCAETFDGTFRDGRVWFADHRASAHPEIVEAPKQLRRSF